MPLWLGAVLLHAGTSGQKGRGCFFPNGVCGLLLHRKMPPAPAQVTAQLCRPGQWRDENPPNARASNPLRVKMKKGSECSRPIARGTRDLSSQRHSTVGQRLLKSTWPGGGLLAATRHASLQTAEIGPFIASLASICGTQCSIQGAPIRSPIQSLIRPRPAWLWHSGNSFRHPLGPFPGPAGVLFSAFRPIRAVPACSQLSRFLIEAALVFW